MATTTTTQEQNRQTFLRFLDLTNQGKYDELDPLVSRDYVGHIPFPTRIPGFAGEKEIYAMSRAAMPDVHLTADTMIAEGDYVVGRGGVFGTHTGADLFGVPASGKKLHWTAIDIARFEDGQVAERWLEANALGLMQQLGLIPTPGDGSTPPEPEPPQVANDSPTTPEQNKAMFEQFIEVVWNKRNLDFADEVFHSEATSPSAPQLPPGPAGVKVIASMFHTAFPDYWMKIDFMVAEGDQVAARFTQGGTHQGDLMGIPPTGKEVKFTEMGILRWANGKVVESWYEVDMLGMMGQLGLGPG